MNQTPNEKPIPAPIEHKFERAEIILALLCLPLGFLFVKALPVAGRSLTAFLFCLAAFITSFVFLFLLRAPRRHTLSFYLLFGAGLLLSLSQFLLSNSTLHLLVFLYTAVLYLYWIGVAFGRGKGGPHILSDIGTSLFSRPLQHIGALPRALTRGHGRSKGVGKTVLWILLGLVFAIVPCLIVGNALSYDERFAAILDKLFHDLDARSIVQNLLCVLWSLPWAMYLFAAFRGGVRGRKPSPVDEYGLQSADWRVLPPVTPAAMLTPLLILYLIFFVSQGEYYLMAFGGRLPDDLIYSEYARRGFFELCGVSAFNALLLFVAHLFSRRREDGTLPVVLRVYTAILSAFTLVLIATALSKMLLYIRVYGLSQKRLYTTWMMLFLAVAFVLVILSQFPRLRHHLARNLLIALTAFVIVLSLVNTDRLIADWNVNAYLEGDLNTVDVDMLYFDLGDSAVPALDRLANKTTAPDVREYAERYLRRSAERIAADDRPRENNLPRLIAKKILRESGYLK